MFSRLYAGLKRLLATPQVQGTALGLALAATAAGLVLDPLSTLGVYRNVILGCFVISLVVGVHELSHLAVARLLGMTVHEFAIGFGPRITGFRAGGIAWNLRAAPLGGFVKLHGEEVDEGPGSFVNAHPLKRIAVYTAGPISNLALAWAAFTAIGVIGFGAPLTEAATLSFRAMEAVVTVTLNILGTGIAQVAETGDLMALPVGGLPQMMVGAGDAFSSGFVMAMILIAVLSMSVGLMNILPIPPMDGGQAFLIIVKSVLRDRTPEKALYRVSIACLVFLTSLGLGFIVLDMVRILSGYYNTVSGL